MFSVILENNFELLEYGKKNIKKNKEYFNG